MAQLINVTTSEARVEGRKPYSGYRNNEEGKEDRVVGRSTAVDAIIPESQDVATPQYRRTAHDFPSLSHPHRFCSPFRRTVRQNLAQLLPFLFSESSAISLRRILHSKPCPTSWTLGKHILYFPYVTLHWILMKFWGINFLNYTKWRKRIQGKLKIWKSLKDWEISLGLNIWWNRVCFALKKFW